jgi:thiol-disulfide isomerase/thioredoxin
MKSLRQVAGLLLSVSLALGPLGCASGSGSTSAGDGATDSGADRFSSFSGQTLDGKRLDLGDKLGKDVVLVSFWATWCEPCKTEMPFLQSYHEKYQAAGLSLVSVSIDGPDTAADVAPYIRRLGYTFPIVLDEDGAIAQRHNPAGTAPFAILVGRDGRVVKRIAGFQPSEAPELEREIRHLLGLADDVSK